MFAVSCLPNDWARKGNQCLAHEMPTDKKAKNFPRMLHLNLFPPLVESLDLDPSKLSKIVALSSEHFLSVVIPCLARLSKMGVEFRPFFFSETRCSLLFTCCKSLLRDFGEKIEKLAGLRPSHSVEL